MTDLLLNTVVFLAMVWAVAALGLCLAAGVAMAWVEVRHGD